MEPSFCHEKSITFDEINDNVEPSYVELEADSEFDK